MGVGAAWVANNWVQIRSGELSSVNSAEVSVVTAALNIPYGTKITERHIDSVMVPKDVVPFGAVTDISQIDGHVATTEILAGEMLMRSRFSEHEGGSTLSALISPNMRAITVRVDDVVGVGGFLLPGNYVDVLATKVNRRSKTANTETIIKKVKVLAVDQLARADDSDPVVVRAVTLEMNAKESEILTKRRAEGTIQLTLRNPNDEVVVAKAKPAPVKKKVRRRPYVAPAPEVTIIRGTHTSKQKTKG